jgi:hypothetical protein
MTENEDASEVDWKFTNMKFTQTEVENALSLKHTKVQGDHALFDPTTLEHYLDIAVWLKNPKGEHGETFRSMTIRQFTDYKAGIDAHISGKLKTVLRQRQGSKGKKRDAREGASSEGELLRARRKKHKGKERQSSFLSDDIDSDL